MSQRVDVIRRPPVGKAHVIAEGVTIAEAGRLINSRQGDLWWPIGLARTLTHISRLVLLNEKRPIQDNWPDVKLTERDVERHVLNTGGNVGMRCGDGLGVLDFDNIEAEAEMQIKFGKLEPTVTTGSGKRHYYFKLPDGEQLPAKIRWNDQVVGEIQRTKSQQVVCPPSIHPITNQAYVWAGAAKDLAPLPEAWVNHLRSSQGAPSRPKYPTSTLPLPAFIKAGDNRGHEWDSQEWEGPDAQEIIRRALLQPGARSRSGGVKFQCAGCRAEGRDKHRDNAIVYWDGRWGCAVNDMHRKAIGESLGIRRTAPNLSLPEAQLLAREEAPLGVLPEVELGEMPEAPLLEEKL